MAHDLLDGLAKRYPTLTIDRQAVLFGAATHDLGKTIHPDELTSPGHHHEPAGEQLLLDLNISPHLARFARTHGDWQDEANTLEDLVVSVADTIWKGKRLPDLETLIAGRIAATAGKPEWEVWSHLDRLTEKITSRSDERLAWQRSHPV